MMLLSLAYRAVDRLTLAAALLGVVALFGAMLITVGDVLMRNLLGVAVIGTLDMIQLCIMATAFLAIPYAFMTGGHVGVELFTDPLPPRGVALVKAIAAAVGLLFMAGVGVYGWGQAAQQIAYGDSSQTIGIPMAWYWAPLLLGAALSVLATLALALRFGAQALTGRDPVPGAAG